MDQWYLVQIKINILKSITLFVMTETLKLKRRHKQNIVLFLNILQVFWLLFLQVGIPVHIQRWEFQVLENHGTYMEAASIGDLQEPLNAVVARTRKYLIVLIATADIQMEKLKKETEYITDHISSEGY